MTKYLFLAGLDVLPPVCMGCGSPIHDQFILRVSPDLSWHAACLKVSFLLNLIRLVSECCLP
jgi:hypothetical protein